MSRVRFHLPHSPQGSDETLDSVPSDERESLERIDSPIRPYHYITTNHTVIQVDQNPAPEPEVVKSDMDVLLDVRDLSDPDFSEWPKRTDASNMSIQRASSLEFVTYKWKNVVVTSSGKSTLISRLLRREPETPKVIIKDAYGILRPGELVAIMGSSGAGKTTLLNALTFRNPGKLNVTGDFRVNGAVIDPAGMAAISAYIQQDDLFIGQLTVREHLEFHSKVRMHPNVKPVDRTKRINNIMEQLGLTKCANVPIGIPGKLKGISGGERKKLAFACEVLTDPRMLFCDEPTSGLDSFGALNVVSVLRRLADEGRTIVCTIHQPSSAVFAMFHRVLLMSEGRLAFLGSPADALALFQSTGYMCPQNYNLADFFIDVLAVRQDVADAAQGGSRICAAFEASDLATEVKKQIDETRSEWNTSHNDIEAAVTASQRSPYRANWCTQFRAVFGRTSKAYIRDKSTLAFQFVQTVGLAILLGIIYFNQKFNQEGIQNINGCLFLCLNMMTYQYCFAVLDNFTLEQPIFFREHFNGMYRVDVYFLSKTLVGLPAFIFLPCIFTAIIYYMIGFNPDIMSFFLTMLIFILIANTGASFGFFISCLVPNISLALVIGPALIIPLMLFGGFFINSNTTPSYLVWIHYISWFFYGNNALEIVQWKNIDHIKCSPLRPNSCPPNGQAVLDIFNVNPDRFNFDMLMLGVLCVGYRFLAYLALFAKSYRRRK